MKFAIVAWKISTNTAHTLRHRFYSRKEAEKQLKNAKRYGFRDAVVIEVKEEE